MGTELLSYLEQGKLTFSVIIKSFIASDGRLIGIPEENYDWEEKPTANGNEENGNDYIEVQSKQGLEVECRMDEIYPQGSNVPNSSSSSLLKSRYTENSKHFDRLNTASSSSESYSMQFYPKVLSPSWRSKK